MSATEQDVPEGLAAPPVAASKRTRARRGEGEKLRDQILEAAERLLLQTGDAEAVTIRAVADAVGVTPPSVYLHFADKNDLLFAVCTKHFERLDQILEAAAAGSDDPLESLRLRGRAYVRFGVENPEHYRILFMGKPAATPPSFDDEHLMQTASFEHLVGAVAGALQSGAIEGEPRMVALGLWAAVHGLTSLLIAKPDFPWPEVDGLIDHLLAVQLRGLVPR
jgi:AcrR family transcriptional regulator